MRVEEYSVQVEFSNETGHRITEAWYYDGELHCTFGPAIRKYDEVDGRLESERWMINGMGHRDGDKPHETVWNVENGIVEYQVFMVHGQLHRENDKPAQITYDGDTGQIVREEYFKNNIRHRDRFAAIIVYDPETGGVEWEQYYKNGYSLTIPDNKPGLA